MKLIKVEINKSEDNLLTWEKEISGKKYTLMQTICNVEEFDDDVWKFAINAAAESFRKFEFNKYW